MTGKDDIIILADWGNSSGRIFCIRGDAARPEILGVVKISGAKDTANCAAAFEAATADWRKTHTIKEAWLCGAVTSNIGWVTTPYSPAPAHLSEMKSQSLETEFGLTCHFLQGTSLTKNIDGYFDTVRGEDLQAHGWGALTGLKDGWLCLPGTHTKWIEIADGAIVSISTGVTGETFDILDKHSILTRGGDSQSGSDAAFLCGVNAMQNSPRPALTHMLMSVRNLQLSSEMTAGESRDYLSGLLIGEDCAAATARMPASEIHIIGDGPSAARYELTLETLGLKTTRHDGRACVIAGLQAYRTRQRRLG